MPSAQLRTFPLLLHDVDKVGHLGVHLGILIVRREKRVPTILSWRLGHGMLVIGCRVRG